MSHTSDAFVTPIATKRTLAAAVSHILKPHGFKNDRLVWYREENGIVVLLALTKSRFGFQTYSFDAGVHVRELGRPNDVSKTGVPLPGFGSWQLEFSTLERTFPRAESIKRALDLEDHTLDPKARASLIEGSAAEALPILDRLSTKRGIRELIKEEPRGWSIAKVLREWASE